MVTPEVQRARGHFKVFLLAARRCNEFRELPSGYLQFLSVPTVVLYAFVIEIGFKALALHTLGTAPKGHDLAMVADAFEVWRYINEKHPVDTDLGFLQRLARTVDVALTASD